MYSAAQLTAMIDGWKLRGDSKDKLTVEIAEACIGWPYVWGSLGEEDTVSKRQAYMNREVCPGGDKALIRKRCQVLNESSGSCSGCKYFPNGQRTRMFDCRGFTRKVLEWAGCGVIQGAGATSQYNTASNWSQRGELKDMPDVVCCVFKDVKGVKEHTGIHIGGGVIIHCSVEVKRGSTSEKGWTHYAIPKGLDGEIPDVKPTLRRGSKGEYVTLLQTKLIQQGYDCGKWGADGSFGAATEEAVKKYQRNHELDPDGVVGAKTWDALDSGEVSLYTVRIEHLGKSVADEIVKKYGGTMTLEEKRK